MKKNTGTTLILLKILQPVFNVLFYAAIFLIALSLILTVIIFFINVDAGQMLLAPFMGKVLNDETGELTAYSISFGNGINIITASAEDVELSDIKAALYAGIFVFICTLLTIAPIFKFLYMLLKNINSKEYINIIDKKNPRYVMYIGLCVFFGTILIKFMMRFYNYYLAVRFIKGAPQEIKLSLGVDVLSGITGLAILFIGMVFAFIFECVRERGEQ